MQKSILVSLLTVGLLASVIGVGTYAYFSDTETSMGNTMTAGTLDLKVAQGGTWVDNPGILVTIADMKPSYEKWSNPVYLKIVDNPGKVYKRINVVQCVGNQNPEPEQAVETSEQEALVNGSTNWLPGVTEFAMEVNDGPQTTPVILNTILGAWQYLGAFEPQVSIKVEQYFHMVNEAGNVYQGDQCTFEEQFLVLQWNDPSIEPIIGQWPPLK